ncbi:MAG: YncE family protein [Acidobacteriaceae bacterium]
MASKAGSRLQHISAAALLTAVSVLGITILGCGDVYRPVVSAINPVGPAAQPQKYAVVVSDPGNNQPGLLTIVDFSGDSVLINANLGVGPKYLALGDGGATGYVLNNDGTLNSFSISTSLLTNQVQTSTLLANAQANSLLPTNRTVYVTEPGRTAVAAMQGTPPSVKQEVLVGADPVYLVGNASAQRVYAISQGGNSVTAIETSNNTVSNTIPVGHNPVYGVMSADNFRTFITNEGDGTVSVINSETNQLDATHPTLTVGTGPVWDDIYNTGSELLVANSGSNTVSIINTSLCNNTAQSNNSNCDPNNPQDSVNFGQTIATVPVGKNPVALSVLQAVDGTQRAYVANHDDGTVSVINLTTNTVTKTIPVTGHPNFIAATTGTPTGKVYVTSPDSSTMSIISTQTDTVTATVNLQGKAVQVRVTSQ